MKSGFILGLLLLHFVVAGYSSGIPTNPESKEEGEAYGRESTIPDCSHACGGCEPCKLVMVSFKCSAAESCPVVYRCMCHGHYFHVPSQA